MGTTLTLALKRASWPVVIFLLCVPPLHEGIRKRVDEWDRTGRRCSPLDQATRKLRARFRFQSMIQHYDQISICKVFNYFEMCATCL